MRPPAGIFYAMLLGVVVLLFALGIGLMISEVLPEIIQTSCYLGKHAGGTHTN